ncbi:MULTISPECIES: DUF4843 domain-containing protein [Sphingobacterium]|uniref:DUF4843 domain-containing protein n=1 Tax=Sphingobacterium TaxID=28453 RepID=UPI0013DC78D0|nr:MULTISPECIES: DUF4843 domain-containing protein [unclassified Sphingobacterium]
MTRIHFSIIASILLVAIGFSSCDQEIDNIYKEKARIQFKYYSLDFNRKMVIEDETIFSFGMADDDVKIDTARIVVEFLGIALDKDRTYQVRVNTDSTTAVEGVHYKSFSMTQTFRANRLKDTLKIPVIRENLSPSFNNPEDKRLTLEMVATDDFDLGMKGGLRTDLYINNYLSEPKWWSSSLRRPYIGFYHPKKWKILISYNIGFTDPVNCPFDYNNQGRSYFQGLNNELNAKPTFDDETGYRIYLNSLEPRK